MSNGEVTPPKGTSWTAFIPRWVKVMAPSLTAFVAVISFALGLGEGRGAAAEVVRSQAETISRHTTEISRHTTEITELRASNARLEGKVDALLAYFKIPAGGPR